MRQNYQALEEERDGLSHILGRERSHGTGLEQLIEASRLREASVAAEQRRLAREKDRLETKVRKIVTTVLSFRFQLSFILIKSKNYLRVVTFIYPPRTLPQ